MRNKTDILILIGWILLSEGAGIIGSVFTAPSIPTWYATLVKPALNPPTRIKFLNGRWLGYSPYFTGRYPDMIRARSLDTFF
jgi:hypothetical protein